MFFISTNDGNMGGVRIVIQKVLNGMTGQRTVSVQEAVYIVDDQKLVIRSKYITNVSLQQGASLKNNDDNNSSTDIISRYRN